MEPRPPPRSAQTVKKTVVLLLLALAGCHSATKKIVPPAADLGSATRIIQLSAGNPAPRPAGATVEVFKDGRLPERGFEKLALLSLSARAEDEPGVEAYFVECARSLGGDGLLFEVNPPGAGAAGPTAQKASGSGPARFDGTVMILEESDPKPHWYRSADGLIESGVRPAHPVTRLTYVDGKMVETSADVPAGEIHDPLEDLPEYHAAFADASQLAEEKTKAYRAVRGPFGAIHVFWAEKKKVLKEKYGIDWKMPAELNPGVNYD